MRGGNFKISSLVFIIAVIMSSAFLVSRVFVYDTNVAHPGLTKLAGELYNSTIVVGAPRRIVGVPLQKLTNQEINWLMQGAIEEDTPLRWMNHFYDPIYNKGYKGSFDTAKKWSQDVGGQTSYSQGDQTWQRAIYEYQKGNKKEAFIALGHILHLLEDLTVPAHTRDDGHPSGDPYESWVRDNFQPVNGSLIYFNSLDSYFDYLANYSNKNFYSEDTIESKKYLILEIFDSKKELFDDGNYYMVFYNKQGDNTYPLFFSKRPIIDWKVLTKSSMEKSLTVKNSFILSPHFSLLAPKAVGAGAGVIKLFFEEAQRQQAYQPPLFQINPLGIVQQGGVETVVNLASIYQNISQQGGNLWGATKNLLWNFGDNTARWNLVTELLATQAVLAQELKNAVDTSKILVTQVPARIIAETGQAVVSSFEPNPSPAPVVAPVAIKTEAKPETKSTAASPSADKTNKAVQTNQTDPSLLSGFRSSPSAPITPTTPPPAGGSPPSKGGDRLTTSPRIQTNQSPIVSGGSSYSSVAPVVTTPTPPPASPAGGSQGGDSLTPPPASPAGGSQGGDSPTPPPLPDTTPPDQPIILEPPLSPFWTKQATSSLRSELSLDTVKLFLNDFEFNVSSTFWSGVVGADNYLPLVEGENIFHLRAADLAGNLSATSSVQIIRDSTAPPVSFQSAIKQLSNLTINLSWSGDDGAGSGILDYDLEYQKQEISSASSSEWLVWQIATTSSQAVFSGETGFQYQFRVRATDQLGNLGEWALSEVQSLELPKVVINEIAWGGTLAAPSDEWLELYNASDFAADLSGWILTDGKDINIVFVTGTQISRGGYFLLERTNDRTIADIAMDTKYTGSLHDSGEKLQLKDAKGRLIDEVDCSVRWFAGRNEYDRETMERINPLVSGNLSSNWQTTPRPPRNGWDAKGNPITGTPKRPNSPFIYLNGTLTANRTLTAENNPYFLSSYTIASGTVLTFDPGVIVKAGVGGTGWGTGNLLVYGTVVSQGTTEAPVVFTSYRDSTYAGHTNTWDSAQNAGPGEWEHLIFYPGSRADLQNTKILYGNYRSRENDPKGALIISGAEAILSNITVSYVRPYSGEVAVNLTNASTTISQSSITDNPIGLLINGGVVNITNSLFENNGTGLEASQVANLIIKNNTFKSNGGKTGGLGSARIRDSLLISADNQFQNNSLNGLDWSGNLNGEQIIDNAGDWPWIFSGFTVPAGSVLTVKAGSHLKMKNSAVILIQGALQVDGTESQPVVFTTYHDDSDGFDSDGIAQPANPTGGEWYQLRFDSAATSTLNYLTVRYANQRSLSNDPAGSVYINQTPVIANHLQIKYSRLSDVSLHLKNANQVTITNSLFKNDYKAPLNPYGPNGTGILIDAGAPIIANSTIDTFNYGVWRRNQSQEQLININYINVDRPMAW